MNDNIHFHLRLVVLIRVRIALTIKSDETSSKKRSKFDGITLDGVWAGIKGSNS